MMQTALHDKSRGQRRALRGLALSGSALALALACGGSTQEISSEGSGNSAGTDNNTGGSAAGASGMGPGGQPGGSNAGGSTGGSGADGGAGNSSGGTGAAAGGAAGSGGMSGDGGGASGGTAGSGGGTAGIGGGAAGAGGAGGAGGSGGQSSGAVAEPGDTCSSPGALACAGNHQRVTLICSGGSWQVNETCPENHACDTAAGFDQGTCKERLPECASYEPGHMFCEPTDGARLVTCGPDNVSLDSEDCRERCEESAGGPACIDGPNPCPPEGSFVNCGTDCGERECDQCVDHVIEYDDPRFDNEGRLVVRIPSYESACRNCFFDGRTWRGSAIRVQGKYTLWKITVQAPWRVAVGGDGCSEAVPRCIRVLTSDERFTLFAGNPTVGEQNVVIERDATPCP